MSIKNKFVDFLNRFSKTEFKIKVPVFGMGCGVIGLSFAKSTVKMGHVASVLLKSLEYRGYDSTGAAIQDDKGKVILKKDVGAPSDLVKTLGITDMTGKTFCGQVRWATFGAVDQKNAQPHIVKCKKYIYGAHNGNITNTIELKNFLIREGHSVVSDNDGEMLVHVIEHYFNLHLEKSPSEKQNDPEVRGVAMRSAILDGSNIIEGSYASVIVDPVTEKVYAIKAGSSLYAGVGELDGNKFILVSSDLTSILKFTKNMIHLSEGYFMEFDSQNYQVYTFKDVSIKDKKTGEKTEYKKGEKINVSVKRSKLRAEDTELIAPYKFFMHQEIYNQVESARKLISLFQKGSDNTKKIQKVLKKGELEQVVIDLSKKIIRTESITEQKKLFNDFKKSKEFKSIVKKLEKDLPELLKMILVPDFITKEFYSPYANVFLDIIDGAEYKDHNLLLAKLLDTGIELREVKKLNLYVDKFADIIYNAWQNHAGIYTISCGTSYNATKTAALFFNEISNIKLNPILPGNFRGQYSKSMRDNDVLIGVSQSGETKDLIDIFNDVEESGIDIKKVTIINNENSTLAQEKCDIFLPIKCGPEIAVPATKSYMNQVILFYYLALKVAEKKLEKSKKELSEKGEFEKKSKELKKRFDMLGNIPDLIDETLRYTDASTDDLSEKLFLEPSVHILATKVSSVAEEGALKIRETVLNHTQGIEGSEFKHGPNTILGFNTIFGTLDMESVLKLNKDMLAYALTKAGEINLDNDEIQKLLLDITEYQLEPIKPFNITSEAFDIFKDTIGKFDIVESITTNYPLIYITGPDERDVNLTISQINTHHKYGLSSTTQY